MKKYYLSHIDFSEINNITTDEEQINNSCKRMQELGLITEKGNPSFVQISKIAEDLTPSFFSKLEKRIRRRTGGIRGVYEVFKKLNDNKEYTGMFFYLAFLYGFLEWQVPERIALLPASYDALKVFCSEFINTFENYFQEKGSERFMEDGNEENL